MSIVCEIVLFGVRTICDLQLITLTASSEQWLDFMTFDLQVSRSESSLVLKFLVAALATNFRLYVPDHTSSCWFYDRPSYDWTINIGLLL